MNIRSNQDAREAVEHIEVAIRTPQGTWPTEGFIVAPAAQRISMQLEHAKQSLHLEGGGKWTATAGGRELEVTRSYSENNLADRVFIDYRPGK